MKTKDVYVCKQCKKRVRPVKGKLYCCGITEEVSDVDSKERVARAQIVTMVFPGAEPGTADIYYNEDGEEIFDDPDIPNQV